MNRKQIGVLAGVAVVAAAGLGAGIGIAATGSPTRPAASAGAPAGAGYSWYRSMMGRYNGGTMMGGTSGPPMMSIGGYQWMMGGAQAPGWMHGGRLPTSMMGMMGAGADPGKIMGRLSGPTRGAAPVPSIVARGLECLVGPKARACRPKVPTPRGYRLSV